MDAIIDDFAPRMTQAELAVVLKRRHEQGSTLTMSETVGTEADGARYTVFSFYDAGLKFAELYHPGDWRENGSEANSLHSCFRYFFKIEEKEED